MWLKEERDKFYLLRKELKQKWQTFKHGTCCVLLYHRVTNLALDPQLLAVNPENFYEHINFIKKKYNLLTIHEFAEVLTNNKKFPKNSFILTFDDGYADNLYEALPILESLNVQALFFIATATLGTTQEFWWDDLERIFLTSYNNFPEKVIISFRGKSHTFITDDEENRKKTYTQLHPIIKPLNIEDRIEILTQILSQVNLEKQGRTSHRPLTWQELEKLAHSPSSIIGCHTHNHVQLSALPHEEQYKEIDTSKRLLESSLKKEIPYFSFPFGSKSDYNQDTLQICRALNLKLAYANYPEKVKIYADNFQIPRFLVRNWKKEDFANYLLKLVYENTTYLNV